MTRDYRLRQEFITPYTPEQNGLIERLFRSLKEECAGSGISRLTPRLGALSVSGSTGTTRGDFISR
jgi:transposase InsO family protein